MESRDAAQVRWENAWSLANNARAIAQMERQRVADTGGEAAKLNDRLVSHMKPDAREQFEEVRVLLAKLPEELTSAAYRKLLIDYLTKFLEITAA